MGSQNLNAVPIQMKGGMQMVVSKFKTKNCEKRIECHIRISLWSQTKYLSWN